MVFEKSNYNLHKPQESPKHPNVSKGFIKTGVGAGNSTVCGLIALCQPSLRAFVALHGRSA